MSHMTLIGVYKMHGRVHPNYLLLVVDLHLSLAYFMTTYSLPVASKLPIKTLVARQLPTSNIIHLHLRGNYIMMDLIN